MNEYQRKNLEILTSIKDGFEFNEEYYEDIVKNSPEILMSKTKNVSSYGMFLPCKQLQKIFVYKGRLVKNEDKSDFVYYFDKDKRLILTKRQFSRRDINYIFYYYHDSYVDSVWYDPNFKEIKKVSRVETQNGAPTRWICGNIRLNKLKSYEEYLFTVKEGWVKLRTFSLPLTPNDIERESEHLFTIVDGA